jgi:hypothetical protein
VNTDPSTNLVVFEIKGYAEPFLVEGPTQADDCVERAWSEVPVDHRKAARKVTRIYSEWQPSPADVAFIERTFTKARLTYSFWRPGPDGWETAYADARQKMAAAARERGGQEAAGNMHHVIATGELLPLLWSATSPRIGMLNYLPHREVVPGHLFVGLATVGMTPSGTFGMNHLTHAALGQQPFDEAFRGAAAALARGLHVDSHKDTRLRARGDLLVMRREGALASSAIAMPDFHRNMGGTLGHDKLIVGLPDPDTVLVARMDAGWTDDIQQIVLSSAGPLGELVPCVLSYDAAGVRLLAERPA